MNKIHYKKKRTLAMYRIANRKIATYLIHWLGL